MAGASDKARFYLEQHVPELQDYAAKHIFTPEQITAIAAKRSDFEHILAARGSTPADYARYATYEMNLDTLRKHRCKRLALKGARSHNGQRTVFFIMERATKKFPGDMGLWMQYIQFCQKEKATKKLAKVLTAVLRLKPREYGLWVLAAKWYAEELGDMSTARSYMQRGLRFCKDAGGLWVEYCKMEMVYLAKLAARRQILGLDEEVIEKTEGQEDDNMITLPTLTAADIDPDAKKGIEQIDEAALKRLADAPAFTGAIPIVIFDAAMVQFRNDPEVAEMFYDLVASFNSVPSSSRILQHIFTHLQTTAPTSAEAIICEAKAHLTGLDALSPAFPTALGKFLAVIKSRLVTIQEKQKPAVGEKTVLMLLPLLAKHEEDPDEGVEQVLVASLNRYLRLASSRPRGKVVRGLTTAMDDNGKLDAMLLVQLWLNLRGPG